MVCIRATNILPLYITGALYLSVFVPLVAYLHVVNALYLGCSLKRTFLLNDKKRKIFRQFLKYFFISWSIFVFPFLVLYIVIEFDPQFRTSSAGLYTTVVVFISIAFILMFIVYTEIIFLSKILD